MSIPEELPEWATDTSYPLDADPDAGADTKNEPPSGYKATGARRGFPVQARYLNWLYNLICRWLEWLSTGSVDTYLDLPVDQPDGTRVWVKGVDAIYRLDHTGTPFSADNVWIVDASVSGEPTAQWIHQDWSLVNSGHLAAVGTVPGGLYGGTSGRIAADVVPSGRFGTTIQNSAVTKTMTTVDAALGVGSLANWGGGELISGGIGTLAVNDQVTFHGACAVQSVVDFSFGVYVEQNDSGTFIPVSTSGAGIHGFTAPGGTKSVTVPISFAFKVTVAGTFRIYLKGNVASAGTATAVISTYRVDTNRP